MKRTFTILAAFVGACGLAATMGCDAGTPLAPVPTPLTSNAAADGSTLKVTAPTPVSPVNNATVSGGLTLVSSAASGTTGGRSLLYEFELQSDGGSRIGGATVGTTNWTSTTTLAGNTAYKWRVRATLDGAVGPWSGVQGFRTPSGPPGCINGLLLDPKAYFFSVINRTEGSSANDYVAVLSASGFPPGYPPGAKPPANAPFYGITQQVSSGGGVRGVIFLPTEIPEGFGFYTEEYQVALAGPGGLVWGWSRRGGSPYVPRACP